MSVAEQIKRISLILDSPRMHNCNDCKHIYFSMHPDCDYQCPECSSYDVYQDQPFIE